jgi:hypothetical protein
MDLTLANVLTAGGAVATAALITGLIEIVKKLLPIVGARSWEPLLAFVFSLVIVVLAFASTGAQTIEGAFWAFLAWFGIATISMGIHDQVTGLRSSGG